MTAKQKRLKNLIALAGSVLVFLLSQQKFLPVAIAPIEAIAAITSAWSVWLLGNNLVIGWWIGLVGVVAYAIVFTLILLVDRENCYVLFRRGDCQFPQPKQ